MVELTPADVGRVARREGAAGEVGEATAGNTGPSEHRNSSDSLGTGQQRRARAQGASCQSGRMSTHPHPQPLHRSGSELFLDAARGSLVDARYAVHPEEACEGSQVLLTALLDSQVALRSLARFWGVLG